MPNPKIFCNVPWSNVQIYWDGSFGLCCQESHKNYHENLSSVYNLNKMTTIEYFNSLPAQDFRKKILEDRKVSNCSTCYNQEDNSHQSKRIKENFKSVIFTEQNFEKSYIQSPWYRHFENSKKTGITSLIPIDWHVDLGNECNLACKMCNENASSKISSILKKNNLTNKKTHVTWLNDTNSYNNFLKSIDLSPINRIHFMGGEPTVIKKFYKIIDYLIEKNRKEISISFVTNGADIKSEFIDKLKFFKNVDIELSIESLEKNNDYIRQGSSVTKIIKTIELLKSYQDHKFQLVLRTVPQLLSINTYASLIDYAYENKLIIESSLLENPTFMQIKVLPLEIRKILILPYEKLLKKISSNITYKQILNGRSTGTLNEKLLNECNTIIYMLSDTEPENIIELQQNLVKHLKFWDKVYKMNVHDFYPEYKTWLVNLGYNV